MKPIAECWDLEAPANNMAINVTSQIVPTLVGKRIRLKLAVSGLGKKGDTFRVYNVTNIGSTNAAFYFEHLMNSYPGGLFIYYTSLEIADGINRESLLEDKKLLQKRRKALDEEIQKLDDGLSYLTETGQEEATEDEMRVFNTLKALDKDITPVEKAKLLAKIMRG